MIKNFDLKDYNLIFVISNHGSGSKIIKYANNTEFPAARYFRERHG